MKRLIYLTLTFVLLLSAATPAMAGTPYGVGQEGVQAPQEQHLYLPFVTSLGRSHLVMGQIKNAQDVPMSGVSVSAGGEHTALTDANGIYRLVLPPGKQTLAPSLDGYNFQPTQAKVDLGKDLNDQHFTAVLTCTQVIPNPGFELVPFYWNPISGAAGGYTPYYSTAQVYSGTYSAFTGIAPWQPNVVSYSRMRSHEITIPYGATAADVSLQMWQQTTEPVLLKPEAVDMPVGFDPESPDAPILYEDMQYIAVVDPYTNEILQWLLWSRRNDQTWTPVGPISLLQWAGRTIKIEFGVYNNGWGGTTSAFFDDVYVSVCPGTQPPTIGCTNTLLNSNFEGTNGWLIRTANYPSAYSTAYAYSASRSMQSGIPLGLANPFPYQFTTGEFFQPVIIPADAYYVRLRMALLPQSTQWYGPSPAGPEASASEGDTYDPQALAATESQYAYLMDSTGIIERALLFRWYHWHSAYWLYREYDLINFRGQAIGVLFGAANDGWGGNTALYVDDVYLEVCR